MKINLDEHRFQGIRVFSGRKQGKSVRMSCDLDMLDLEYEPVEIHIPEDVFAVTQSFLVGLFTDSVAVLGVKRFCEHYTFTGYDIERSLHCFLYYEELK